MNETIVRAYTWIRAMVTEKAEGAGMAEYALLLVLVAIAVITALTALGNTISSVFDEVVTELN